MPWNWDGRGAKSGSQSAAGSGVGGGRGQMAETYQAKAWPNYELAYLAKRLGSDAAKNAAFTDKGKAGRQENWSGDELARFVYLDKATASYKQEADEALKNEFNDWLQGQHETNAKLTPYVNEAGKPLRRHVYRDTQSKGGGTWGTPGEEKKDWVPTWWGKGQLTHLDGVRDYLRAQKVSSEEASLAMNYLAEHGPQNIDQAWAYFKHWVKGRPLTDHETMSVVGKLGEHGSYGDNMPSAFYDTPKNVDRNRAQTTLSRFFRSRNFGAGTAAGGSGSTLVAQYRAMQAQEAAEAAAAQAQQAQETANRLYREAARTRQVGTPAEAVSAQANANQAQTQANLSRSQAIEAASPVVAVAEAEAEQERSVRTAAASGTPSTAAGSALQSLSYGIDGSLYGAAAVVGNAAARAGRLASALIGTTQPSAPLALPSVAETSTQALVPRSAQGDPLAEPPPMQQLPSPLPTSYRDASNESASRQVPPPLATQSDLSALDEGGTDELADLFNQVSMGPGELTMAPAPAPTEADLERQFNDLWLRVGQLPTKAGGGYKAGARGTAAIALCEALGVSEATCTRLKEAFMKGKDRDAKFEEMRAEILREAKSNKLLQEVTSMDLSDRGVLMYN